MWFADLGLASSLALLAAVVLVAAVPTRLVGRVGWATPSVRRAIWIGAVVAAALLVAQAAVVRAVADGGGRTAVDQAVLDWFVAHRVGWATALSTVLAVVGGPGAMAVLAAVAVLVLLRRGDRVCAAVVVGTGIGAGLLGTGAKLLYGRSRPPLADQLIVYTDNALPSNHALGSTVMLGLLAAVMLPGVRSGARRVALVAAVSALVAAVGVSRNYLGAHWFTDVLAGWLLGGAWLTVGVTVLVLLRDIDRPASSAVAQLGPPGAVDGPGS